MALKESTREILNFLRSNVGQDLTAKDVAEELGLNVKSVNGAFNSFEKKGWGNREEVEIELEDSTHAKVKFLRLNNLGMTVDPDAPTPSKKNAE